MVNISDPTALDKASHRDTLERIIEFTMAIAPILYLKYLFILWISIYTIIMQISEEGIGPNGGAVAGSCK